jgi:multidrug efflux system membrane fusion protein
MRQLRAGLALVAVGALIGCAQRSPDAHAAAKDAPDGRDRAVPVAVAVAERRDVPVWLDGLGTVAAFQQVTVRPQVDGRLDKVLFHEGELVKRGQVLAQIDPRPFLAQLHQAEGALARDKAQLESGKLNLVRYQELIKGKFVGQQQVDDQAALVGQAEGAVAMDQAAIENARLQVDYARITSPLDGIAGVRLVDAGNLVRATDATGLVVITQIDPVAVFFTLPEDELPRVTAALARGEVPVEVRSRDDQALLGKGKLLVLDNQINTATATLRLKAIVPNPARALWPNQFVKARLLLETLTSALVVPTAALQRGPDEMFVYVVAPDQTAAAKPVTVTFSTGELAVLGAGVDAGAQVVVDGQNQLRPGTKLLIRGRGDAQKPNQKPGPGKKSP